jgi:hypothetical protein
MRKMKFVDDSTGEELEAKDAVTIRFTIGDTLYTADLNRNNEIVKKLAKMGRKSKRTGRKRPEAL